MSRIPERKPPHPLYAGKILYNLRGGFLVRPLAIALGLGIVGSVLSNLEADFPAFEARVPGVLFPSHADPQVAQTVLTCVAGSVMTVVSIVFAILLMSLTLASMQFSPRIILSFTMDRVTQWTLGVFLGTFSYCVAALPAARSQPHPFAPTATVSGAMILSLVCVGWLLFFINHIARAISVNHIVDRIAGETEAVVDETMPYALRHGMVRPGPVEPIPATGMPLLSPESGYVRHIDFERLVRTAKTQHINVHVLRRVGHFIPEGVPLAIVEKDHKMTPEIADELVAAFDLGPTRTLQQDIEFGILQIVDIALKAISPAVNDPSTAISCVDHLSRILIRIASKEPVESRFYDPPGVLRVSVPVQDLERMVNVAFEQIRSYSKGDVAVNLRILRALGDISQTVQDPSVRKMLVRMGSRVISGAGTQLEEGEMQEMNARLRGLEDLVQALDCKRTND